MWRPSKRVSTAGEHISGRCMSPEKVRDAHCPIEAAPVHRASSHHWENIVMTKHYQMIMRLGVFCTVALLLVPFLARPTRAASSTTAVDVARIDAFVRQQVERHGIPGLALALVDGEQII